jgi:signal transduction histidine kinase
MSRRFIFYVFLLLAGLLQSAPIENQSDLASLSISELKQQLESIDAELNQLASYSLRGGSGSVGYSSLQHARPNKKEWVRIELGTERPIDQIVLVPSIKRNPGIGLEAEGFPIEFRILAGTEDSSEVVASFTEEDHLLPRIAPLVVPFPQTKASWITVEATLLSKRDWDDRYALYFSEILVFHGLENVALKKPVQASSSRPVYGWDKQFLTDGFLPYLMDSSSEGRSQATGFRIPPRATSVNLTIDLETPQPINQIYLHTADLNRTIPQTVPGDFSVPRLMRIYGATQEDFSDQSLLYEYQHNSIYDVGPIIALAFPQSVCRYVRFQFLEPPTDRTLDKSVYSVSFSEIEILSEGRNIALGKPIAKSGISRSLASLKRMTDGYNFFGKILPLREWMDQLAHRHELEKLRPQIEVALAGRYEHQKHRLTRMVWIATLLAVAIGFAILIERFIHRNQLEKIRSRFAADIHDELGANLHAIGLLSDLAKDAVHSPDDLIHTVEDIRALTERTGLAARHCADMYEAKLCENMKIDMERTARRILADIKYQLSIEGEDQLQTLRPGRQADLFLFFKESLVNISRHSEASKCNIHLTIDSKTITLKITDNGQGISGKVPASLKRRARLLKGKLSVESPETGGTCISLHLQRRLDLLRRFTNNT